MIMTIITKKPLTKKQIHCYLLLTLSQAAHTADRQPENMSTEKMNNICFNPGWAHGGESLMFRAKGFYTLCPCMSFFLPSYASTQARRNARSD